MASVDKTYHNLAIDILNQGYVYDNVSRDIKCKQVSSYTFFHAMNDFPLITTKKMATKSIVAELLWFLRGDSNIATLESKIWDKDAVNFFTNPNSNGIGDVGRNYGVQWRSWTANMTLNDKVPEFDQITELLKNLLINPMSRRHIVTAWNPAELDMTALPPCHWAFEIIPRPLNNIERLSICKTGDVNEMSRLLKTGVGKDKKEAVKMLDEQGVAKHAFSLKWHQRSVDTFLGLPFNIASYALLGCLIEGITEMPFIALYGDLSNVHLYEPHYVGDNSPIKRQLNRSVDQHQGCQFDFSETAKELFTDFRLGTKSFSEIISLIKIEDFNFINYKSYSSIKAEMFEEKKK